MASHGHYAAWHVLVAAWDRNTRVMMLGTCDGLDAIRNDLSSLK